MNHFRTLFGKEVLAYVKSTRFVLVFLMCFAVTVFAFYAGSRQVVELRREYRLAERATKTFLDGQDNWTTLGTLGVQVVRPPNALRVFSLGVERSAGTSARVDILRDPEFDGGGSIAGAGLAGFDAVDFAYVVSILVSLVVILLGYDTCSGEREQGTLKLILSGPVSRHAIFLAKLTAGGACLLTTLASSLAAGLLVMLAVGVAPTAAEWLRIAGLTAASAVFIICAFSITMLVSTLVRRSTTALVALLIGWTLAAFVVPKLSVLVAEHVGPRSSRLETQLGKEMNLQHAQERMRVELRQAAASGLGISGAWYADAQSRLRAEQTSLDTRLEEEWRVRQEARTRLTTRLSRVSPVCSYVHVAMALAGTAPADLDTATASLREYRRQFADVISRQVRRAGSLAETLSQRERIDVAQLPVPVFTARPLGAALHDVMSDLALLLAIPFCSVASSYVAFIRYDPR